MGSVMAFFKGLAGGSSSNTDGPTSGGAAEEQGTGSGNTGYRNDGSNPFLDKKKETSPWNTILGMSQAGGAAKSMLATPTGNKDYDSEPGSRARAGLAGAGRPEVVNPQAAAWDRYMQNYGSTGQPVDPMDADIFQRIWK